MTVFGRYPRTGPNPRQSLRLHGGVGQHPSRSGYGSFAASRELRKDDGTSNASRLLCRLLGGTRSTRCAQTNSYANRLPESDGARAKSCRFQPSKEIIAMFD